MLAYHGLFPAVGWRESVSPTGRQDTTETREMSRGIRKLNEAHTRAHAHAHARAGTSQDALQGPFLRFPPPSCMMGRFCQENATVTIKRANGAMFHAHFNATKRAGVEASSHVGRISLRQPFAGKGP